MLPGEALLTSSLPCLFVSSLQDNAHGEKALLRVLSDICGEHGSKPMPGVKVGSKGR